MLQEFGNVFLQELNIVKKELSGLSTQIQFLANLIDKKEYNNLENETNEERHSKNLDQKGVKTKGKNNQSHKPYEYTARSNASKLYSKPCKFMNHCKYLKFKSCWFIHPVVTWDNS